MAGGFLGDNVTELIRVDGWRISRGQRLSGHVKTATTKHTSLSSSKNLRGKKIVLKLYNFITMSNSSDSFTEREVLKKKESLTKVLFKRFWKCLSSLVFTLFKYLATRILWICRVVGGLQDPKSEERSETLSTEKLDFLERYGDEYGYSKGPLPIDQLRSKEFSRMIGKVYLDHAGATLYTETQIKATFSDLSTHLYGNPHSQSESGALSSDVIESARHQVLAMCKASSEEYSCVFTSGATGALKLVGETFPWSSNSHYMYTMENHNSVVGIREFALNKGATITPVYVDHNREKSSRGAKVSEFHLRQQNPQRRDVREVKGEDRLNDKQAYNLFAFPLECNFSGAKFDLGLIPFVQQAHHTKAKEGKWLVLLDAAKGCSTGPPDLSRFYADFVAISFYKIFGYPTGLGALLVRKNAAKLMKKEYFGGGTVAVALADDDYMQRRSKEEEWLEDGTVSFLGVAALRFGFGIIDQLHMSAISRHTGSLVSYTASRLYDLKHYNNACVCVLYGNHDVSGMSNVKYWGSDCEQGPIVSFNLKRSDGSWIGPREVEKLAALTGIHLRSGCFCNPGACSKYLGLTKSEMKENFEAGHVCWDDKDLINGYPTGAVRVSFGYMNTFEDSWAFIQFISKFFVEQGPVVMAIERDAKSPSLSPRLTGSSEKKFVEEAIVSLQSIVVYPIKSCGGFEKNSWPLGDYGLLYDREWLIKSVSGEMLTQKKCPVMCFIQTYIDLESGLLHVHAPHMKDELIIPLMEVTASEISEDVCLCSDRVTANDSGVSSNKWFTEALGVSCTLIRRKSFKHGSTGNSTTAVVKGVKASVTEGGNGRSFANEGQFLLVSQESVEDLNRRLLSSSHQEDGLNQTSTSGQSTLQVDAVRFRPNLVVSGSTPYDEDNWQSLRIGDQQFQVISGCNRCKMINVDHVTGKLPASGEPLVTLASYRRVKGKIFFGILLEQDTTSPALNLPFNDVQTRPALYQASRKYGISAISKRKVDSQVLEVGQRLYVARSVDNNACLKSLDGKSCIHTAKRT